jgi:serine/threonine protein kinase
LLHDGLAKIADFGVCKVLNPKDLLMSTNIGTFSYMAPEILSLDPNTTE